MKLFEQWQENKESLLDGMTGSKRAILSQLLENQKTLTESMDTGTTAGEGRTVVVTLTPEGRKLAERTVHRILTMEDEIFGTWTDEEIDFYLELTERYRDQIKDKIEKNL